MFTLSENWDSTENQDNFIKEYFGKTKVLLEESKNRLIQQDDGQNYVQNSKDKEEFCKYQPENITIITNKKKYSANDDVKINKKKFQTSPHQCYVFEKNHSKNDLQSSNTTDVQSQRSNKNRKKSKKKNRLLFEDQTVCDTMPEDINKTQISESSKSEKISKHAISDNSSVNESTDKISSITNKRKYSMNNDIKINKKIKTSPHRCYAVEEVHSKNDFQASNTTDVQSQKSKKNRKKSKKKNGILFENQAACDTIPKDINKTQISDLSKSERISKHTISDNSSVNGSMDKISSARKKYSLNCDIKHERKIKANMFSQDRKDIDGNYIGIAIKNSHSADINFQESKKKSKEAKKKRKEVISQEKLDKITNNITTAQNSDTSDSGSTHTVDNVSSNLSMNKTALMKNKFYQKLQAAKFRYLNEMLYTNAGEEALSYFQQNTSEFQDYHIGYQSQVSKWPINPVDIIIQEIHQMNKVVIADLGCGEAKIAEAFPKLTVHSFDFIALKDCVTACDIAKVPLPNNSVDVAVFCLSLMGTNWQDYIKESHRILKLGAVLKIAEIESRIEELELFIKNIESCGFSLENKNLSYKMLIFLNFEKTNRKRKCSRKVPHITLKPCLYKKR